MNIRCAVSIFVALWRSHAYQVVQEFQEAPVSHEYPSLRDLLVYQSLADQVGPSLQEAR